MPQCTLTSTTITKKKPDGKICYEVPKKWILSACVQEKRASASTTNLKRREKSLFLADGKKRIRLDSYSKLRRVNLS
jgi:hypothetical protein